MYRCFQLAQLGAGLTAPNPMVGAVLVYGNTIIGEGFHRQYGQAHAEVNCINSVATANTHLIKDSTLYVSLEPCAHFGKTPPCADLIIKNNITKVVIGCRDSYKEVAGRGIEKLQGAGVMVTVGVLEKEAQELNRRFFTFHEKQRPYIILKWAQSADKKIGSSKKRIFISNEYTNRLVHRWRHEEAAIMVGTNTALLDDPALTTRLFPGKNPVRLVIDTSLKLPASLKLFDGSAPTMVFNAVKQEPGAAVSFFMVSKKENIISQVLRILYQQNIQSLMVEGGAKLLQSFIDADLWDEARVITNTGLIMGDGTAAPQLRNEQPVRNDILDTDTIDYFLNHQR